MSLHRKVEHDEIELVYERTENVVERPAPLFEQKLKFGFIDILNEWTFVADDDYENEDIILIQFLSKESIRRKLYCEEINIKYR